jgi:hypothetical protein
MKAKRFLSSILLLMLWLSTVSQQAQAQQPVSQSSKTNNAADAFSGAHLANLLAQSWRSRQTTLSRIPARRTNVSHNGFTHSGFTLAPMAAPAVHGNGTVGKISMWVGTHPSGNSILGDSIITQLNGNIGIGLATPMSKLTVAGMIETTLGGYKFPDGTVQTTAAVSGLQIVSHDATLTGDGTPGLPLGVAVPLVLSGSANSNPILSVTNTAFGSGVGVRAQSDDGGGVHGDSINGIGVLGSSKNGTGVDGFSRSSEPSRAGVSGF